YDVPKFSREMRELRAVLGLQLTDLVIRQHRVLPCTARPRLARRGHVRQDGFGQIDLPLMSTSIGSRSTATSSASSPSSPPPSCLVMRQPMSSTFFMARPVAGT